MLIEKLHSWRLHSIDHFDRFSPAWDLVNRESGSVPFLYSPFVRRALAAFGSGGELLAVLGPLHEPLAMAILLKRQPGVWETFQPSQLPLGAWVMARGLSYADIAAPLLRQLPGFPLLLAITQQDSRLHPRPPESSVAGTVDYIRTGWIEIHGSFDEYWKERSKGLRQNMRTQRSRLAREAVRPVMEIVTAASGVEGAIREYSRLEAIGWKGKLGTAVTLGSTQGQFYVDVLKDYCESDLARIYVYRFDDRVVAIDLNIVSDTTMVLLKTTYDETIPGLSPSSLLREELLRDVATNTRIRRIEFYGPAMEWTYRWTDRVRDLFHVNIYRSSAVRALRDRMRKVISKP